MKVYLFSLVLLALPGSVGAAPAYEKVFLQCTVSQGNGFNWASTLGWLSEITRQTAEKAAAYGARHPGSKVAVDMSCQTGASSSGFVTALLDRLLNNPSLSGVSGREPKLLSPEQAFQVAEALRFLSLSTDFNDGESLGFLLSGLKGRLLGHSEPGANPLGLSLWEKSAASASHVIPTFLKWVVGAELYRRDWRGVRLTNLDLFQERERGENLREITRLRLLLKKYQLSLLLDFPELASRQELNALKRGEKRDLEHLMRAEMERARTKLATEVKGKSDFPSAMGEVLDSPLSDGFCVDAFVIPVSSKSKAPLPYEDLKILFLCNEATYQRLSSSTALQTRLGKSDEMRNRILLGSVSRWENALNITVREPDLLPELTGTLDAKGLGVLEVSRFSSGRFRKFDPSHYLVVGGFPEQRLQSWIGAANLLLRKAALESKGTRVDARLAIFGKVDGRKAANGFAERMIVKYFTPAGADPAASLKNFHRWQDEFCKAALPGLPAEFYRMDWNLSDTPAAIFNRGYILTAKGINLARVQTDLKRHAGLKPARLVFDSRDTEELLPTPPAGGLACPGE